MTDRRQFRMGVALVDRDEFGSKTETDDGDARFVDRRCHKKRVLFQRKIDLDDLDSGMGQTDSR